MFNNILIADNDVESRDRLYEILFSMGHKVDCTPNANETLARLQGERPQLLIVDERLPMEGGIAFLEEVRKFDKELKVVLLIKDHPDTELENKVRHLRLSAIVEKDFSSHILLKKILEILKENEEMSAGTKYHSLGKILIVDDSADMRSMLASFLKKKGFNALTAINGDQALMEFKIEKPKLVLLDERMPGMDGLVVLKKIKALDGAAKVVMLTAVQDNDVISEATKLGACDYIIKPFDLQKLEALVMSLLIQRK